MSIKYPQAKMARGRGQLLQKYRQHQTFDHKTGHIARVLGYRADERYAGEIDKDHLIREGRTFVTRWRTAARNGPRSQQDGAPTFPDESPYSSSAYELVVPGSVSYTFFPLTLECGKCRTAYVLPEQPEPGQTLANCPRCGGEPHNQLQHIFVHNCGYMVPFVPPPRCSHCSGTFFRLEQSNRFRDFRWICQNPICKAPQDISRACNEPNCQYRDNPMMRANVHTASEAYIPHGVKVVNPPLPEHRERSQRPNFIIATVGHWLGLCKGEDKERIIAGKTAAQDPEKIKLLEVLREFSPERAAEMEKEIFSSVDANTLREAIAEKLALDKNEVEVVLTQFSSQLDTYERTKGKNRIRISELKSRTESPARRALYDHYNQVLASAGLVPEDVFLVPDFPVIELAVGYSRGSSEPGQADLRAYRDRIGKGQAEKTLFYAHPQRTEALVFGVDPERIERWLGANGHNVEHQIAAAGGFRLWFAHYLTVIGDVAAHSYDGTASEWLASQSVMRLMHTMSHQFIRALSVDSGFAETSLSEHFFPYNLSFAIYPRARGEFVIGGLRTVLEQNLNEIVERAMDNDQCIYDPNCYVSKGADHGCLFLPETACTFWNRNQLLSRWDLFGGPSGQVGYWAV